MAVQLHASDKPQITKLEEYNIQQTLLGLNLLLTKYSSTFSLQNLVNNLTVGGKLL